MLKSKSHRATVTQAELNYVGSITIDKALMDAAGLIEYEKVQVVDIDNGARFETYIIEGEKTAVVSALTVQQQDVSRLEIKLLLWLMLRWTETKLQITVPMLFLSMKKMKSHRKLTVKNTVK